MKERQTKKSSGISTGLGGRKTADEERKFVDHDLTPEEIARLQEKIRREQAAKAKSYQKANLIDWQAGEAGDTGEGKEFFANEKKDSDVLGKVEQQPPKTDYFNSDFF